MGTLCVYTANSEKRCVHTAMLNVVLCDQDEDSLKNYAQMVSALCAHYQIQVQISCFESGDSLLFHYAETHMSIHLLYLSPAPHAHCGIETAHKLRACGCEAQIIFISEGMDYVFDAFDVHAQQYLLKDSTTQEKFEQVFLTAINCVQRRRERQFVYQYDGGIYALALDNIMYFEIWRRIITIYNESGSAGKFYGRMEQLEQRLQQKNFVRIQRSYLVSLPHIASFDKRSVVLQNEIALPIGKKYLPALEAAFLAHSEKYHTCYFPTPTRQDGR